MSNELIKKIKTYFYDTLKEHIGNEEFCKNQIYLDTIFPEDVEYQKGEKINTLDELLILLSKINEKEVIRKKKGVYYTPQDITDFIVKYTAKLYTQNDNFNLLFSTEDNTDIGDKTFFDPTCGAGEFLLSVLKLKFQENNDLVLSLKTLFGNDINPISVCITKIRLILFILKNELKPDFKNIVDILNTNFFCIDYINDCKKIDRKFDILIGNPPYVEDSKSKINLPERFGNIYANVLVNAAEQINENGCYAFIIPISYNATPRMKKLRATIKELFNVQYILSYADRPGCLFQGVHQKLCILIAKKIEIDNKLIFTNAYTYWYQEERDYLFKSIKIIENTKETEKYIPKLGNNIELAIYEKINNKKSKLSDLITEDNTNNEIYLNMRAAFWIKAFLNKHDGNDYSKFNFNNENDKYYFYCLINSSLFWYFWICISDCWHITWKELDSFSLVSDYNPSIVKRLAINLENKLENTKEYIGSKQIDYVYKHKNCLEEIKEIDCYINNLLGLTDEETAYITNYALKYRTGNMINE